MSISFTGKALPIILMFHGWKVLNKVIRAGIEANLFLFLNLIGLKGFLELGSIQRPPLNYRHEKFTDWKMLQENLSFVTFEKVYVLNLSWILPTQALGIALIKVQLDLKFVDFYFLCMFALEKFVTNSK